ncbi:MAG: YybH family protein [Steroidobacteraceae bacterium]
MRTVFWMVLLLCGAPALTSAGGNDGAGRAGIDSFNEALAAATRGMDNGATLALWEEDGISLLPETPPIVGKAALAKFMDDVLRQMPGAHMQTFELHCFNIEMAGHWASEWCQEHQQVRFVDGKPPFEGWGNMLLVLHRGSGGAWRLKREMWNKANGDASAEKAD